MNKRHFVRLAGLMMVMAMLLTLMLGVSAQDMKVLHTGISMSGGDLNTIDPSLSEVSGENTLIKQMFLGLTGQDEVTGDTTPGIATDWSVSEDGKTFTFNLMHEIPWVHYNAESGAVEQVMDDAGNPRYVTAQDLVYGWLRTLDPATASVYAYLPAQYVVGGDVFNGGTGTADDVEIAAVDDYTFQVTTPEPVSFVVNVFGLWMLSPLPSWSIESAGDLWTEPENISTFGPFALKEWAHDESITIIKNPFWPGTDYVGQAKLDEVVFHFLDPQTQFAEYQAGTLDAISPPLEEIDRIHADPVLNAQYSVGSSPCTYYLGVNQEKSPLGDSVHLRRALSYAIDRQSIVDNVTKGGQIPARWFSRPGLAAAPTLDTNPDLGITYDPEMARAELALALDELGLASVDDIPTITLAVNDSAGHRAIIEAIQQMWTTELGITAQISALDSTTYFTVVSEDAPPIYRSGWCQDYPDANNFLRDVLYSTSEQNDPHFNNAEFDALLDEARTLTDIDARRDLYAQAEQILVVDEVGIIPIYWYTAVQLTQDYVERTHSIIGREAYWNWDLS
jgi:oligopeptide transport system substrate-binding protein